MHTYRKTRTSFPSPLTLTFTNFIIHNVIFKIFISEITFGTNIYKQTQSHARPEVPGVLHLAIGRPVIIRLSLAFTLTIKRKYRRFSKEKYVDTKHVTLLINRLLYTGCPNVNLTYAG